MLYVDNYAYMHIYTLYIIVYYKGVAMIAPGEPSAGGILLKNCHGADEQAPE